MTGDAGESRGVRGRRWLGGDGEVGAGLRGRVSVGRALRQLSVVAWIGGVDTRGHLSDEHD